MTTIKNSYANALLADATYALRLDGLNNVTGDELSTLLKSRMTPTVAQYIGDHYTVVTHIETDDAVASGFDATVWRDNTTGKLSVSMQGTTGLQDFLTDAKLTLGGNAGQQVIDMVNWWLKITTPIGQMARQIGHTVDAVSGLVSAASDVPGAGLVSAADLAAGIEVNGHSLGGYLATAFTRLFGAQAHVTHTSTFNSAGFALGSESAFVNLQNLIGPSYGLGRFPNAEEQSNYFAANGLNFTTNSFYFNQQGQRVEMFNESDVTQVGNHYIYKLTDALALGAALERLDSTFTMDKLNAILKAGSGDMVSSYEGVLDGLRRVLLGNSVAATPASDDMTATNRSQYQANIALLTASETFKALAGKATLNLASSELGTTAKTDYAAFLSLSALSPVVLSTTDATALAALQALDVQRYLAWRADKNARLYGDTSKAFDYSDNWYSDRAAMLGYVVQANAQDTKVLSVPGAQGMHYEDLGSGTQIDIGLPNDTVIKRQTLFGDAKDNILTGKKLADHLYGMAGNDILDGQGGNDYLEGGSGTDIYQFSGSWGKDIVLDADGQGQIQLDGQTIGAATASGRANQWKTDLGGAIATLTVRDDPRSSTGKSLIITRDTDSTNSITLNNFDLAQAQASGYLGIKLDSTRKLALQENTGTNLWSDPAFSLASLAGKASALVEGTAKTFTLYLNQAAKAGETITLALSDLADKFKAILGDSVVVADGAVITLAEGQTQVSFALRQEGDITADAGVQLSATYAGADQSVTSNAWSVNLMDAGEAGQTMSGDQRAKLIGIETRLDVMPGNPSFGTYAWNETNWAADGTLNNGVTEANFNDVIYGAAGNDKMLGMGGNDALDGGAGNDRIDGGDGDDNYLIHSEDVTVDDAPGHNTIRIDALASGRRAGHHQPECLRRAGLGRHARQHGRCLHHLRVRSQHQVQGSLHPQRHAETRSLSKQ